MDRIDDLTLEFIDNLVTYVIEAKHKENTYKIQPNKDVLLSEAAQIDYNNLTADIETVIMEANIIPDNTPSLGDIVTDKETLNEALRFTAPKCDQSKGFGDYLRQGGRLWD